MNIRRILAAVTSSMAKAGPGQRQAIMLSGMILATVRGAICALLLLRVIDWSHADAATLALEHGSARSDMLYKTCSGTRTTLVP